jgi:5-methylcytosine-specific restriction endonuclease McrA
MPVDTEVRKVVARKSVKKKAVKKKSVGRPRKSEAHKKAVNKKTHAAYDRKPAVRKKRNDRNKARRKLGLKPGDGKEVDHKKPLSKGGSNAKSNLRVTTPTANRRKFNH